MKWIKGLTLSFYKDQGHEVDKRPYTEHLQPPGHEVDKRPYTEHLQGPGT